MNTPVDRAIRSEHLLACGMGSYAEPRRLEAGPFTGNWVHLAQMMFTCAVMVSGTGHGNPITRWCYHTRREAKAALDAWDGNGDPPGEWIKRKPEEITRTVELRR